MSAAVHTIEEATWSGLSRDVAALVWPEGSGVWMCFNLDAVLQGQGPFVASPGRRLGLASVRFEA